jgi:hypothetical protein
MEEDIHATPTQPLASRVLKRLTEATDKAAERARYEAAHNSELLRALQIVHAFLKTRGRVCYGGTAMNAILPASQRFYDPELDLPDYDFFTPDPAADVEELTQALVSAGFKDVYSRMGMHEGTKKVLVNFVPIADISHLDKELYDTLHTRAVVRGGIRYVDPDILRMMMYLELSRPKGEVERWEKVYERLQLINNAFPPKRIRATRKSKTRRHHQHRIPSEIQSPIMDMCVESRRILIAGGSESLDTFYRRATTGKKPIFSLEGPSGPIAWLTPSLREDANQLKSILGSAVVALFYHKGKGELGPEYIEVRYKGRPAVFLFQEVACHSLLSFPTSDGRTITLGSMDTLITLYYAISIFTRRAASVLRLQARIPALVGLVEQNRQAKSPPIPAFPIVCSGYQKGFATLMREKVERIRREKEGRDNSGTTRRRAK